jgi:hypothetical protein
MQAMEFDTRREQGIIGDLMKIAAAIRVSDLATVTGFSVAECTSN